MRAVLVPLLTALALLACDGGEPADTATSSSLPRTTVTAGPVAATELVTGDCVAGLVIGSNERARIDSAEVVACTSTHEVEVFATFGLTPGDFEVEDGGYPGQQRIVDRADRGCNERFEALGDASASIGLLAVWPTAESWAAGDREVACAVYPLDGQPFEGRGIIGRG